ncbi:MAG: bifunctional proline dehydrogenase/L-glutamate gamma-semialdehyde dehydrogenase PutA [Maricaulaceae bacterium]
MNKLSLLRRDIQQLHLANDQAVIQALIDKSKINETEREAFSKRAVKMVNDIRADDKPGIMEQFLGEYGLSTDEGVALMCLAEALLRVPDSETIDDLIHDKIAPSSWGQHLGKSSSSLVNASTWGLMLTGKVLDSDKTIGLASVLHGTVKRLGEPIIRAAVSRAMKEMGNQFVLGETIQEAVRRGQKKQLQGFTYSYDMLGEAALTSKDAKRFYDAYSKSIDYLSTTIRSQDIRTNPGVSIKLSALHPRYELGQKDRVMTELTARVLSLAVKAKKANMGLNIDAEEMDRLDLSLDVIETVLRDDSLAGWDGFGVVVQAYSKRASAVIEWLYELSKTLNRKIMVRLVKGAYWDTEIKRAQVEGISGFPVYSYKSATDVSYICCAKKLLGMSDRIYPQFATHNAHTVASILELAPDYSIFEFQALHGMGEVLYRQLMVDGNARCRIYAPVGAHRNLLAYLVRRLLENGANSSFVNQIIDDEISPDIIARDPFATLVQDTTGKTSHILNAKDLFAPVRVNSKGWDLHNASDIEAIEQARSGFKETQWTAQPILAGKHKGIAAKRVMNPANDKDIVGTVVDASEMDVELATSKAKPWSVKAEARYDILNNAADLYEENFGEIFAVLTREAGKVPRDAIAELREAVDFLRYYAAQILTLADKDAREERGVFTCISPWNFPLAIFTGQIAAALAVGNAVLAKPAETTPIIASLAVKLLHKAGVPKSALQLLPGHGRIVGAKLTSSPSIKGVCFTGSTATAHQIHRSMADKLAPYAPLIAETGGLNAMIVDSTALPEQAVQDIVDSAFRSSGQRCSALRILYLQDDIADGFMDMLFGAMDELTLGDPWENSTDIGPIITHEAKDEIVNHISAARKDGRLLKYMEAPDKGSYVGPAVISVSGLKALNKEVFGPVLHIATFKSDEINSIVRDINDSGYGLTFGLHTRIDQRVEHLTASLRVGNIYVNRNQIGAIVGSQPFGGEGISGTGPKAGGPHYLKRFTRPIKRGRPHELTKGKILSIDAVQEALDALETAKTIALTTQEMSGPTGESNRLSTYPRGKILCLGPTVKNAKDQVKMATQAGCSSLVICAGVPTGEGLRGVIDFNDLTHLNGFDGLAFWGRPDDARLIRMAIAARNGAIIPIFDDMDMEERCVLERHVSIDTTASGGNVSLLAGSSS